MDKLLKTQYQSNKSDFITLFLPGFPGEYKDRPLFDDLKSYGSDIYSLIYPGTYDENGAFSVDSAIIATKEALHTLRKLKKPILIVAYSFSTLFVSECVEQEDNVLGILFFSPITNLKNCIREDFKKTLHGIKEINGKAFKIDLPLMESFIDKFSESSYLSDMKQLMALNIPLVFFIGSQDRNVKTEEVYSLLSKEKGSQTLIYRIPEGEHGLDTLYNANYVRKAVLSLILCNNIKKHFTKTSGVYLWGSTLNYPLDSDRSDLDMIVIGEEFSYDSIVKLNELKSQFERLAKVKIDLVFNSQKEISSKKIIRRNRGALYVYEMGWDYFPLFKNIPTPKSPFSRIKKDVLSMYYSSIYHARKSILNYDFQSEARILNIKNFIYNCRNYLYLEGVKRPTLEQAKNLFKEKNIDVYKALQECILIKTRNYEGLKKDFDVKLMRLLENLFSEHVASSNKDWYFEEDSK